MKSKWIQSADREMERKGTKGTFGKATKKKIARAKKRGGKIAKKARFAEAMKKIASKRKAKRSAHGRQKQKRQRVKRGSSRR